VCGPAQAVRGSACGTCGRPQLRRVRATGARACALLTAGRGCRLRSPDTPPQTTVSRPDQFWSGSISCLTHTRDSSDPTGSRWRTRAWPRQAQEGCTRASAQACTTRAGRWEARPHLRRSEPHFPRLELRAERGARSAPPALRSSSTASAANILREYRGPQPNEVGQLVSSTTHPASADPHWCDGPADARRAVRCRAGQPSFAAQHVIVGATGSGTPNSATCNAGWAVRSRSDADPTASADRSAGARSHTRRRGRS
jgi:hypothetical protein